MYTICSTLRRIAMYLMVVCLVSASVAFARNDGSQAPSIDDVNKLPDCKRAGWQQPCKITVDRARTSAVGTFVVASGTAVHLLVFKSPFEKVKFDPERKEVAPPPDPMADLIKLLSGSAGAISLVAANDLTASLPTKTLTPQPGDEQTIADRLTSIKQAKGERLAEIERVQKSYETLGDDLKRFFASDYCSAGSNAVTPEFENRRKRLLLAIDLVVKNSAPLSTAGEELILKSVADLLQKMSSQSSADPAFIRKATGLMDEASGVIRLLQSAIANLDDARKNFTTMGKTLEQLEGAKCYQVIDLVADRQADLSGNIVFTNLVTGQDDSRKLFAKVGYRDLPRASLSTGILLSALEKRKFSVSQKSDGPGDNPTDNVKSHTEIGSEASKPQVIPFSFINVRLAYWRIGSRMFTFNVAPGVGINANGGTTEAEFALGPSLGVGNLYFFGGAHFARDPQLAGGFSVGDRVPKDFSIPVVRSWKTTFGFGVSYRLPLP